MDTSCSYTNDTMYVSTDERWLINRLIGFSQSHPESVEIIRCPEDNDDCIYCKVPAKWLKISPPRKRELTDEQRAETAERLKNARNKHKNQAMEGDEDV